MPTFTRKGDQGIFDVLFTWVEELRANGRYPFGLEEQLFAIEGAIQDINNTAVESAVKARLEFWYDIVSDETTDDAADAFNANIYRVLRILAGFRQAGSEAVIAAVKELEPAPPEDWKPKKGLVDKAIFVDELAKQMAEIRASTIASWESSIARLTEGMQIVTDSRKPNLDMLKMLEVSLNQGLAGYIADVEAAPSPDSPPATDTDPLHRYPSAVTPQDISTRHATIENASFMWTIQLKFTSRAIAAQAASKSIWALSAALETIDGVVVDLDSWGEGSLWARLQVYISNIWAQDSVREVLGQGRDAAKAYYLDTPTEQAKKTKAEREKLEEERAILQQQRRDRNDPYNKEMRELELEDRRQDVIAKKIKNQIRMLDAHQKASELVRDGIISADSVQIDINELSYFLFNGETLIQGEDMQRVEERGKKIGGTDAPEIEGPDRDKA